MLYDQLSNSDPIHKTARALFEELNSLWKEIYLHNKVLNNTQQ